MAYGIPELCEETADIQMFVQDHLAQLYNLPSVIVLKPQQLGNNSLKPGDHPRHVLFLTDRYRVEKEITTKSRELKADMQFHVDCTKTEREKHTQIQLSKNRVVMEH